MGSCHVISRCYQRIYDMTQVLPPAETCLRRWTTARRSTDGHAARRGQQNACAENDVASSTCYLYTFVDDRGLSEDVNQSGAGVTQVTRPALVLAIRDRSACIRRRVVSGP